MSLSGGGRGSRLGGSTLLLALALCLPSGTAAQAEYQRADTASIVVVHRPSDSQLAREVARALLEMPPLPGLQAVSPQGLEVVLAGDTARFREEAGGRPPDWSAGVAIPRDGRIILPAWSGSELHRGGAMRLLRHEWAHVALYRGSGGLRAPRWFSEGYAEWSGGWDRSRAWRLRLLLATGDAPPLDSLSLVWPAGRASAETAYLLSASVVEYLVEASGERGLTALFRNWRGQGDFETALRGTYGLTSGQLEEDWRGWARKRYGWLFVLTHSSLAWGMLAILLAGTAILRRRHNRDRMARLRARELPEAPAYWDSPATEGEGASPQDTRDLRRPSAVPQKGRELANLDEEGEE